ncbi:hypothetical protein BDV93DRAFT_439180 [Ceratobasidium sp. AG-I]|nr:hypothetical protein BDV93DRAFT_439180 [Ceratobasidium sp. AG-I]
METDLKCNRLTCRTTLTDKAVVTTCSHIFCIDCANELFGSAQVCPACESSLTEPYVQSYLLTNFVRSAQICSLHPTNDYKTSVLSGLSPAVILEISGRAISFWQYQIHQESSFQAAILKNVNERIAHLQKQLDNVVREANNELTLLNNKLTGVERDLEVERRKSRDLMDSAREKDKEYQKLKVRTHHFFVPLSSLPNLKSSHRPNTTTSKGKRSSLPIRWPQPPRTKQPTNFRPA